MAHSTQLTRPTVARVSSVRRGNRLTVNAISDLPGNDLRCLIFLDVQIEDCGPELFRVAASPEIAKAFCEGFNLGSTSNEQAITGIEAVQMILGQQTQRPAA